MYHPRVSPELAVRPERIEQYSVVSEIATGATARVFLAQRDGEAELRVLKLLKTELSDDPTARQRFSREAMLATHLSHPNIARTFWSGIDEGHFCIAMEYVPGQTLATVMERLRSRDEIMPLEVALTLGLGILDGLAHAHNANDDVGQPLSLVHRDLSSDNVMVSYAGQAKIIDFGTARSQIDDFRTSPGIRIGTLLYMSPEQAMSMPVDRRTDVYAAAVLFYEMLTGQPLVRSTTTVDVLEEIAYTVPPLASDVAPEVTEELAQVVAEGLAKDPEHRWPTADAFSAAIREELAELTIQEPEGVGHWVRSLFPEAEAAAAAAIEAGRARHFQDYEETIPEEGADPVEMLDTILPTQPLPEPEKMAPTTRTRSSGARRLPPERPMTGSPPDRRNVYWVGAICLGLGLAVGVLLTLMLVS